MKLLNWYIVALYVWLASLSYFVWRLASLVETMCETLFLLTK